MNQLASISSEMLPMCDIIRRVAHDSLEELQNLLTRISRGDMPSDAVKIELFICFERCRARFGRLLLLTSWCIVHEGQVAKLLSELEPVRHFLHGVDGILFQFLDKSRLDLFETQHSRFDIRTAVNVLSTGTHSELEAFARDSDRFFLKLMPLTRDLLNEKPAGEEKKFFVDRMNEILRNSLLRGSFPEGCDECRVDGGKITVVVRELFSASVTLERLHPDARWIVLDPVLFHVSHAKNVALDEDSEGHGEETESYASMSLTTDAPSTAHGASNYQKRKGKISDLVPRLQEAMDSVNRTDALRRLVFVLKKYSMDRAFLMVKHQCQRVTSSSRGILASVVSMPPSSDSVTHSCMLSYWKSMELLDAKARHGLISDGSGVSGRSREGWGGALEISHEYLEEKDELVVVHYPSLVTSPNASQLPKKIDPSSISVVDILFQYMCVHAELRLEQTMNILMKHGVSCEFNGIKRNSLNVPLSMKCIRLEEEHGRNLSISVNMMTGNLQFHVDGQSEEWNTKVMKSLRILSKGEEKVLFQIRWIHKRLLLDYVSSLCSILGLHWRTGDEAVWMGASCPSPSLLLGEGICISFEEEDRRSPAYLRMTAHHVIPPSRMSDAISVPIEESNWMMHTLEDSLRKLVDELSHRRVHM
eukprot:TRINITY_DN12929_c0_g1_i3.p1 TRINITY_DN12929_c0_g1~~TRINITY_DN12929_c0_g1_i3.p1  ORF type:complete len:646 (+),score=155.10 TRINITY_DN12929_c0_g1_i3:86-2023(+)